MFRVKFNETQTGLNIEACEKHYSAKFLGDFCIKNKDGNWANEPVAVFYQSKPPNPEYSNFLGLFQRNGLVYITDAQSAFDEPISVIKSNDGEIIYSSYRHDFKRSKDGSVFIDGGRDYTKCSNPTRLGTMIVKNGELYVSI